jgi:hypothetical protein
VLGKALIGPYDVGTITLSQDPSPPGPPYKAGTVGTTGGDETVARRDTNAAAGTVPDWTSGPGLANDPAFSFTDGADGPGFRVRANGKVTPPYLPVDKFKRQGLALLDHNGHPIMYFPASPMKINLNVPGAVYVGISAGPTPPMFNFDNNNTLATSLTPEAVNINPDPAKALARMQAMMGLRTLSNPGSLPQGKQPVGQPYLLWSVGADGFFGPIEDVQSFNNDAALIDRAVRNCDDVTNFPLPQ